MIRTSCSAWLAIAALCLFCGAAGAASIDTRSDATALSAYRSYEASLVAGLGAAGRAEQAYVAHVQHGCGQVLAPLRTLPSGQVSRAVLADLGREIGDDVALEFTSRIAGAFGHLAARLRPLRWSSGASSATITGMIAAVRGLLGLRAGNLCADARRLTAAPRSEPAATRAFVKRFASANGAAKRQLSAFLALLARYQTGSEANTIHAINALARRYSLALGAASATYPRRLTGALGLPSS